MAKNNEEQPRLISEPSAEYDLTSEEQARKDEYHQRLREYLQDPEFRQIPGFPIGSDDDILKLSDPPYYTACPNPFLNEIIEEWQIERAKLRKELGLPGDSAESDTGYHREPLAADVSEGKNDPFYMFHPYHTKVPPRAVMRYILHYTEPGDIIFDGFAGTGMTGLANQMTRDKDSIETLGHIFDRDRIMSNSNEPISYCGVRRALLVDLSPAATFIAHGYNKPENIKKLDTNIRKAAQQVDKECGWMYETWHPSFQSENPVKGKIHDTVWSDVFICPNCGNEMIFWDMVVDHEKAVIRDEWKCPECNTLLSKNSSKKSTALAVESAVEVVFDEALQKPRQRVKQVPVLIVYSVGKSRYKKRPDKLDLELIQRIEKMDIPYKYPSEAMMFKGKKWGDTWRAGVHAGITHVHHFFTKRNLWSLSCFLHHLGEPNPVFSSMVYRSSRLVMTVMSNYLAQLSGKSRGGWAGKPMNGTLYVPSISTEVSVPPQIQSRFSSYKSLCLKKESIGFTNETVCIITQSSSKLEIKSESVDYIFTDPPFGSNLMYAELNFIWESWLRVFTNLAEEAIVNDSQRKMIVDYQKIMEQCFSEFYRILKPGRWMTVEFHNSKNSIWNSIQEALIRAGFVVADVRTLDKKQGSFKQVTSTNAVKQDLVISAYKPKTTFVREFQMQAGTTAGAWAFTRQHLGQLPITVHTKGGLEVIRERQDYLLFDRMVAFHIQSGVTIPLSAAQFYAGLTERFPKRDGMYFLPEQVSEYDRARLESKSVAQLTLFISDEKTTIQWLRQNLDSQLGGEYQTYQELQPKFLRQLHQAKHEDLPELSELLQQNFLQDEQGRWYMPDPNKASDLENIRNKALLREFNQYLESRGQLKQFRTEAVRAGFTDAWQRKDFETIVKIANRLPEKVLQEDPDLLMYYDNASLRVD